MHEIVLRFLRVGVRLRMLRPEVRLVLAVTTQNEDGFDNFVEMYRSTVTVVVVGFFLVSRHCIQLKLSQVNFPVNSRLHVAHTALH